jgi:tryptophan synthase alpha chain
VSEFADAAVIGSAIVSLIESTPPGRAPEAVAQFIQSLRPAEDPART